MGRRFLYKAIRPAGVHHKDRNGRAVISNGHDVETTFDAVTGAYALKLWRLDDNVVVEGAVVSPVTC